MFINLKVCNELPELRTCFLFVIIILLGKRKHEGDLNTLSEFEKSVMEKQEESTAQYVKQLMDFHEQTRQEDRKHELQLMTMMMTGMQTSMQQMMGAMFGGVPYQPQPFEYGTPTTSGEGLGSTMDYTSNQRAHWPWPPVDPRDPKNH